MKENSSTLFSALADETRLRILNLLAHREISVCNLTNILGESQPKVSRHLAFLRKAGLVTTKREGKWVYYKMADIRNEHLKKILSNLIAWISNNQKMQKDYQKLLKLQPVTKKILEEENIFVNANMTKVHKRDELEIHLL